MVRCSRSGQQCLTSVAGFDFARFAAAWVWGSCQTVFLCGFHCLTSSCYTCFWHFSSRYVHYVHFILASCYWEILNSEKWLFGNLGASKGKRPHYVEILLPFFLKHCLWERRRTIKLHTGASWLLAVSFIPGASNIFFPSQVLEIAICLCSCYSHLGRFS